MLWVEEKMSRNHLFSSDSTRFGQAPISRYPTT